MIASVNTIKSIFNCVDLMVIKVYDVNDQISSMTFHVLLGILIFYSANCRLQKTVKFSVKKVQYNGTDKVRVYSIFQTIKLLCNI